MELILGTHLYIYIYIYIYIERERERERERGWGGDMQKLQIGPGCVHLAAKILIF